MRSSTRIPRDEPYSPAKCLVGLLVANALMWAVIIEVVQIASQLWRWFCS